MIDDKYFDLYPDEDDMSNSSNGGNAGGDNNDNNIPADDIFIEPEGTGKKESIIKVIGVGGGGGNAVLNMYKEGIKDVDFIICNTDRQVLEKSPIPTKIQLGAKLTEGLGAGNDPKKGREAAKESIDEIREALKGAQMVFVTAGMGGGTGTGAAPIVAQLAKEMGILTVGIVTIPFRFEGPKRITQAIEGIRDLRKNVDALLLIDNQRIAEVYSDFKIGEAFRKADEVLTIAAKGIAEIITLKGTVNVDFADVRNVLKDSGLAIMGTGYASDESRAQDAARNAIFSPLLNFVSIRGATRLLFNITSSYENQPTTAELKEIADFIRSETGIDSDIIWGATINDEMDDRISVTVIATGFETDIEQYLNTIAAEFNRNKSPQEVPVVETVTVKEQDDDIEEEGEGEKEVKVAPVKEEYIQPKKHDVDRDLRISVEQLPPSPVKINNALDLKRYIEEPAYVRLGMSVRIEEIKRQNESVKRVLVTYRNV